MPTKEWNRTGYIVYDSFCCVRAGQVVYFLVFISNFKGKCTVASKFITNREKLVSELMEEVMPDTSSMYFLVGYFYFSGYGAIYKSIGNKPLKILVGMDVERDITNRIREYETLPVNGGSTTSVSRASIRRKFSQSLVEIVNDTDYYDEPEREKAFRFFLEKIKKGTLEIRKTLEPNHAKLYIFEQAEGHNQGGEFPGTVLTGSSNLTWSGLSNRFEVNVVLRDPADYLEAKRIFDELWQDAVPIVDAGSVGEFYQTVIDRVWLEKLPKPYIVFLRVLNEYFSMQNGELRLPNEITNEKYFNVRYQTDAIQQGLSIIKKHSGCIIADVVGLGKSIIASAIAYNLKLKTVIIAPPHLVPQWELYAFEFDLSARVYSCGMIEDVLRDNDNGEEKLIIVDEAQRFRNEETIDYGLLHQLCQGNKVILLSATPFNNRPEDIFSLIKLFQIPAKATIETASSLAFEIERLSTDYKRLKSDKRKQKASNAELHTRKEQLVMTMRDILSPLMIRRSRIDLETIELYRDDLKAQRISFPVVAPPQEVDYELGDLSELYIETLDRISPKNDEDGFIGARYKPLTYLKSDVKTKYEKRLSQERNLMEQSQVNLAAFMKRLLVRRFESSIAAFRHSLDTMIQSSLDFIEWYEKFGKIPLFKGGKIPDFDKLEEDVDDQLSGLFEANLDEVLAGTLSREMEKGLVLVDAEDFDPDKQFIDAVKNDLALLESIKDSWTSVADDPKLTAFVRILSAGLRREPNRKFVVFSEFADTVEYLTHELSSKGFRVFKYTSADSSKLNKNIIRMNFDAGVAERMDDYDILIATDAISEGSNLHRAGAVFNYDIPYNPTRVIQRVGRINRINLKVFDTLYIYNFFPSTTGEDVTHARSISTFKLSLIQAIMGEDTMVLTDDEEIRGYFSETYQRAAADADTLSWDVEYLNILNAAKKNEGAAMDAALSIPRRTRIARTAKQEKSGVLIFAKKGDDYRFKLAPRDGGPVLTMTAEEGMRLFRAEKCEDVSAVGDGFAALYAKAKKELFNDRASIKPLREQSEAADRIQYLLDKAETDNDREYLAHLLRVVAELGSMPRVYLKRIRGIDVRKPAEAVKELHRFIPSRYLDAILGKEAEIGQGPEQLILSEELI